MTTDLIFGCGYVGRRVAAAWRGSGRTVMAVTRSPERAVEFTASGLIPIVADICNPATITALPDVDRILFAVGFDRRSDRTQEEVFVAGLQNVLNQMAGRCQRFIYISSTSVYGQSDGSWVDETSPTEPVQPGGRYCLAGERQVQTALADRPGTAAVLRFAGIYGPDRLLSRIADLKAGQPLSGEPQAWLNLIHVDDGVASVLKAADHPRPPEITLVADDRPVERGEYYARLAELVRAPPPQFDPAQLRSRGSGGLNKRCRNQLLHEVLGVALRYPSFLEGLPAAIESTSATCASILPVHWQSNRSAGG